MAEQGARAVLLAHAGIRFVRTAATDLKQGKREIFFTEGRTAIKAGQQY